MEIKPQKQVQQSSDFLSIYNIVVELLKKEVFPQKSLKKLLREEFPIFFTIVGNNP